MKFDDLERRCPRLGHAITFAYCRSCDADRQPCFKVLDCWWERFDVRAYFENCLDAEALARLGNPPPPNKVASLLDLIAQAKQRLDEDNG